MIEKLQPKKVYRGEDGSVFKASSTLSMYGTIMMECLHGGGGRSVFGELFTAGEEYSFSIYRERKSYQLIKEIRP